MGMAYKEKMEVGIVYAPYLDELFYAQRGKGAFLVKKNQAILLHVSEIEDMQSALLATGFAYHEENNFKNLENFAEVLKLTQGIRRCGSAALDLSYVACGRYDGYWELGLAPHDVAAGSLIVEEAKGMVTDWNLKTEYLFGRNIIASNAKLHSQIRKNLFDFPLEYWGKEY
jgi:myo-inositol-1(or 4)-monophosphatase